MSDIDSLIKGAVSGIAAALFGFISAVAVFRSRFAVMEAQRIADLEKIEANRQHDKELLKLAFDHLNSTIGRIERRQIAALELTANIAHKAGITSRAVGADVLADLLQRSAQE